MSRDDEATEFGDPLSRASRARPRPAEVGAALSGRRAIARHRHNPGAPALEALALH
jgi:hypothetical protein